MMTLEIRTRLDQYGHLRLDVPLANPQQDVDVVLVVQSSEPRKTSYDFGDLVGRLTWRGDAVTAQNDLRADKELLKIADNVAIPVPS